MMEQMIKAQDAAAGASTAKETNGANGESTHGNGEQPVSKCPFAGAVEKSDGNVDLYLNEVGLMTELEARKKKH